MRAAREGGWPVTQVLAYDQVFGKEARELKRHLTEGKFQLLFGQIFQDDEELNGDSDPNSDYGVVQRVFELKWLEAELPCWWLNVAVQCGRTQQYYGFVQKFLTKLIFIGVLSMCNLFLMKPVSEDGVIELTEYNHPSRYEHSHVRAKAKDADVITTGRAHPAAIYVDNNVKNSIHNTWWRCLRR